MTASVGEGGILTVEYERPVDGCDGEGSICSDGEQHPVEFVNFGVEVLLWNAV